MLPRFGQSDGRRLRPAQLLNTLGKMPFTPQQKSILNSKAALIQSAAPWIHPALSSNANAPADADSFTVTTLPSGTVAYPFVAYLPAGQGPVTVISYTVQRSKICFIRYL